MNDDDPIAASREHWNRFADLFEREMESTTLQLARTLVSMLRLESARAVLEVGAGAGGGARLLLEALPEDAELVVTDLAPEMVRRARAKLGERAKVQEANACALGFEDGRFDRLMANLNLMLVPDPDAALAEAARVLQPGGRAAWSVWGRREGSAMFTLPPAVAQEVGLELPSAERSNFDLGDREALVNRLRAHGFEQVTSWYQPMIRDVRSGASFVEVTLQTPRWKGYLRDAPADRAEAFRVALAARVDEHLASGEPIGLEALIAVASLKS